MTTFISRALACDAFNPKVYSLWNRITHSFGVVLWGTALIFIGIAINLYTGVRLPVYVDRVETQIAYAPITVDDREAKLLAMTLYGEARSEGVVGMEAVAHVILNRVNSGGANGWPEDLTGVILFPNAFSVWNSNNAGRQPMINAFQEDDCRNERDPYVLQACMIAYNVLAGYSISPFGEETPTYYTRYDLAWRYSTDFRCIGDIGDHRFYVEETNNV